MKPLCIYHSNCADGFASAWVVNKAMQGEVDFHPGIYQDPPPDVEGRDVLLVDFSYKLPVLRQMAEKANSILVLDHHKTAAADLVGLDKAGSTWNEHLNNVYQDHCEGQNNLYAVFDMNRSGAGITWDYFFPDKPRPKILNHIEDRDLWKFKIHGTREIQAAIFSYPYTFDAWNWLIEEADTEQLFLDGTAIKRKHFKDINELVQVVTRMMTIGGVKVPAANLPYTLTSDAGHLLAKGTGTNELPEHPFAACYFDTPEGRVFSLRSADGGVDVSAIAKQYGGGGHTHAAGFRISWEKRAMIAAIEAGT